MVRALGRRVVRIGELLHLGLQAEAERELETSRLLLGPRRWALLVALLPALAGFAVEMALAADLPATIGGKQAYMPAFITPGMFWGSIVTGLIAGLITGVIGAGGGYILTPALMSFGVKGIMAVGTDQFHLFAKAIMGTTIHRKLGNVNFWLAAWFVVGSGAGVSLGGWISRHVYNANPSLSDAFISAVYVVILGTLGAYALADWSRASRRATSSADKVAELGNCARRLQALPLRPRISFDQDMTPGGRSISVYPVILCGFTVGLVAAVMGVGGGFLTFPMFVYGLGVSTFTTVGTDILQIIFTTAYSSILQYALYGYVFYTVAMGMLLGSLVGVQIGATVTTMVKGVVIRAFYAVTILAGFINRLAALPRKLSECGLLQLPAPVGRTIDNVGTVLFFGLVGVFALWVLYSFFSHLPRAGSTVSEGQTD